MLGELPILPTVTAIDSLHFTCVDGALIAPHPVQSGQDLASVEEAGGTSLQALETCILISFPGREHALCQPKRVHRKHTTSAGTATPGWWRGGGEGGGEAPCLFCLFSFRDVPQRLFARLFSPPHTGAAAPACSQCHQSRCEPVVAADVFAYHTAICSPCQPSLRF